MPGVLIFVLFLIVRAFGAVVPTLFLSLFESDNSIGCLFFLVGVVALARAFAIP